MNDGRVSAAEGAVGFTLRGPLALEAEERLLAEQQHVLSHFPKLKRIRLHQGKALVDLWSHHDPHCDVAYNENGSLFMLIGSPLNAVSWGEVFDLLSKKGDRDFSIPWEGRCLLIRIAPDGLDWSIWNDWCGVLPVFHSSVDDVAIASSVEPVTIAAAGLTPDNFSSRGIVELLVHGHFLDTDTLYDNVHTLPADSISIWKNGLFMGSSKLWTVQASDARWGFELDKLCSELHEQTINAITSSFQQHDDWIVPLSGGMDSRLIACVAADTKTEVRAYTYGLKNWYEVSYARDVALYCKLPWQFVNVGVDYLADYTPMWLEWFGTSLHAHGMYQMPFLERIRSVSGCIINGFLGNNMGGGQHPSDGLLKGDGSLWRRFYEGYGIHWSIEGLRSLLIFDIEPYIEEMNDLLSRQEMLVKSWPYYHRMNMIDLWNRQQRFIFYQPMMYHYWKGVSDPFMKREYARFCLSLPDAVLWGRRLQKEMLIKYWPKIARIPGTFNEVADIDKAMRKVMKFVAGRLPYGRFYRTLQQMLPWPNTMERDCVKARKWQSLFPLTPSIIRALPKDGFLRSNLILDLCERALAGDESAYTKLMPLKSLIYRVTGPDADFLDNLQFDGQFIGRVSATQVLFEGEDRENYEKANSRYQ